MRPTRSLRSSFVSAECSRVAPRAGLAGVPAALALALTTATPAVSPAAAQTPVPVGSETQVNTYTPESQGDPSVDVGASGEFVVVWTSYGQDGDEYGVYGQRFDAAGDEAGGEFRVAVATAGYQYNSDVAVRTDGAFVVVWEAYEDGSSYEIRTRRFQSDGTPTGGELPVNEFTTSSQSEPAIDMAPDDSFVVVWESFGQDGDKGAIVGRRFASDGAELGVEFVVNEYTTYGQNAPSVAVGDDGGFVVAWQQYPVGIASDGVLARRFASTGDPLGGDLPVSTLGLGRGFSAEVGMAENGAFVVAWQYQVSTRGTLAGDRPILAQRFASDGTLLGAPIEVSSDTSTTQSNPVIAMDRDGNFVVGWNGQDADGRGVLGRAFDASGDPRGVEFVLATYTTGSQREVALAVSGDGAFVATWSGNEPGDGSGEVWMQRFETPPLFADGFESGGVTAWTDCSGDGCPI